MVQSPVRELRIPQATELSKTPRNAANKAHLWEAAGQPRELSMFCDDPDGGGDRGREGGLWGSGHVYADG